MKRVHMHELTDDDILAIETANSVYHLRRTKSRLPFVQVSGGILARTKLGVLLSVKPDGHTERLSLAEGDCMIFVYDDLRRIRTTPVRHLRVLRAGREVALEAREIPTVDGLETKIGERDLARAQSVGEGGERGASRPEPAREPSELLRSATHQALASERARLRLVRGLGECLSKGRSAE